MVGFVKNEEGGPMRSAVVAIAGSARQYRVSANMAHYRALLPPGDYRVIVRCHGYHDQVNIYIEYSLCTPNIKENIQNTHKKISL